MRQPSKADDQFSPEETQRRFEAALRGARKVGHKPMKDIPKKRATRTLGKVETKPTKAKAAKHK
jgi:hypothetical protein